MSPGAGAATRVCYNPRLAGEMDERFKSHAWKACLGSNLTGVRIPVSPPTPHSHKSFYANGLSQDKAPLSIFRHLQVPSGIPLKDAGYSPPAPAYKHRAAAPPDSRELLPRNPPARQ